MNKNSAKDIFVIALKLILICSFIALLVAGVNSITKDRIAENEALKTRKAVISLFSDADIDEINEENIDSFGIEHVDVTSNCGELLADVNAVYEVKNSSGEILGYCASCNPMGFKDYINLIVSVDKDLKISGVEVVSMQETSGIGTKIQDEEFISKFIGLDSDVVSKVDTISGATKSSKPTISAVNNGLEQIKIYAGEVE